MHGRVTPSLPHPLQLKSDLEFRAAENLPEIPPKKFLFHRNIVFVQQRQRDLNKYLKQLILIYEAIESPILQRFLEIDTNFDPNYEYSSIDKPINGVSESLFLEGDKMEKVKRTFYKKETRVPKLTEKERMLLDQLNRKDFPK